MAVRNLEAINRHGEMIAQQTSNAKKMREDSFLNRVNIIRQSSNDAVDFADTVTALCKNGLRTQFEEWVKTQNVHYSSYDKEFSIGSSSDGRVIYVPYSNDVQFAWSNYGMGECYSVNKGELDYIVNRALLCRENYDKCLTFMAERLQPFIDAFFKCVETL